MALLSVLRIAHWERVEEIKSRKAKVSLLAKRYRHELQQIEKTAVELNQEMLDAYKSEVGERDWDPNKSTYIRRQNPEEKRLIEDMERVLAKCKGTLERVTKAYAAHLDEVAQKPLTFHTPEEDTRLEKVMATKEEYKHARTAYSDAMIDADAQLATGGDPSPATKAKLEEAKVVYEDLSERLCEDAVRYEHIYREELAQRVTAHFTAEQHLLRGVAGAMKDFYPYTRGLTLDWEELRANRKQNLSARSAFEEEDSGAGSFSKSNSSIPQVTPSVRKPNTGAKSGLSLNPFGGTSVSQDSSPSKDKTFGAKITDGMNDITHKLASFAPKMSGPSFMKKKSPIDEMKVVDL